MSEPIQIGRLCCIDPSGVIYIGRSVPGKVASRKENFNRFKKYSGAKTYARVKTVWNSYPHLSDHRLQVRAAFLLVIEVIDAEAKPLH
jgi:hypothetical protein